MPEAIARRTWRGLVRVHCDPRRRWRTLPRLGRLVAAVERRAASADAAAVDATDAGAADAGAAAAAPSPRRAALLAAFFGYTSLEVDGAADAARLREFARAARGLRADEAALAEALVLGSATASAGVPAVGRRRARALLWEAENEVLVEADEADLRLEQAVIDIEGPFGLGSVPSIAQDT